VVTSALFKRSLNAPQILVADGSFTAFKADHGSPAQASQLSEACARDVQQVTGRTYMFPEQVQLRVGMAFL